MSVDTASRGWLDDVWGALASVVVALPSAIAFGVLVLTAIGPEHAALGATVGAIGAAALGLTAPLIGRNGGLVTAPCAPAAAIMSGLAGALSAQQGLSAERVIALMTIAAVVSGALQLLFGALQLGRLIKYLPFQVVTGFLSGIAVIIGTGQLPKLLGVAKGTPLLEAVTSPGSWAWPGVIVGVVTIVSTAGAPRVTTKVPAAIVGLGAGVASYFAVSLARPELRELEGNALVIGPLQGGSLIDAVSSRLSSFGSVQLADLELVLATSVTLSVLLSIDTLKTGVVLDALTRRRSNSNRELVAQGVGNVLSALAGGMPGAGTTGATLVNVTSGGHSPWSGFGVGALSLLAFLVLGAAIAWIPIAALAGILLVIAWKMFDWRLFGLLRHRETAFDFAVIGSVVVVAQLIGLIEAAGVGVALAILLFIRDQVRGTVIVRQRDLRQVASKTSRIPAARDLLDEHGAQGLVVELQGNLFFGTTDRLFSELAGDLSSRRFVLFDLRRVTSMDYTAGQLLRQMKGRLLDQGGELILSGMPSNVGEGQDIEGYLGRLGLVGGERSIRIFEHRNAALEWMEEHVLERAGWQDDDTAAALELHEMDLFRELADDDRAALDGIIERIELDAGAPLFAQGDPGDAMYLIRRGTLDAFLPLAGEKRHHVGTFERGDYVGEMSFLDKGKRSADVEARVPTELFALDRPAFNRVAHEHPVLATIVFARLALLVSRRMRTANRELSALEER
jgi:SulP family sulfate permease